MAFAKQLLEVMQRACLMEALSMKEQWWLLINANIQPLDPAKPGDCNLDMCINTAVRVEDTIPLMYDR